MPHSPSFPIRMANQTTRIGEEQEALFHSYPCALYYVQSPSTASHANSTSDVYRHRSSDSAILSALPDDPKHRHEVASRLTLSPYSSRCSDNNFLPEKKITYDLQSDGSSRLKSCSQRLQIIGINVDGGGDSIADGRRNGIWRFISFDPSSSSCCCIAFQLAWRLMVSVGIAMLVFFLVTKPPAPKVFFKIVAFRKFGLSEGLDNTGVVTKILSCNSSIDMEIDNNSKVFGLYVHPPTMEMAFGRLKFGSSQGQKSYVPSYNSLTLRLYVGATKIPVYRAGGSIQDMLDGQGLPLVIRVETRSRYLIVWNFIKIRYRHHGQCLLVLHDTYDEKSYTKVYNGSCSTTTTHV